MDAEYFHSLRPYKTEQIAVSSAAVPLTAAYVDNTANYPDFKCAACVIEIRTNAIYYTVDGTTPSSTNGHALGAGDILPLAGYQKVKNFKAIRQTADGTLNVMYYK